MELTLDNISLCRDRVSKETKKDNFIQIRFGYSDDIILPYKEGIELIANLKQAENLSGDYDKKKIVAINTDNITIKIMSYKEYSDYKIAALLNISYNNLIKYEQEPNTV